MDGANEALRKANSARDLHAQLLALLQIEDVLRRAERGLCAPTSGVLYQAASNMLASIIHANTVINANTGAESGAIDGGAMKTDDSADVGDGMYAPLVFSVGLRIVTVLFAVPGTRHVPAFLRASHDNAVSWIAGL